MLKYLLFNDFHGNRGSSCCRRGPRRSNIGARTTTGTLATKHCAAEVQVDELPSRVQGGHGTPLNPHHVILITQHMTAPFIYRTEAIAKPWDWRLSVRERGFHSQEFQIAFPTVPRLWSSRLTFYPRTAPRGADSLSHIREGSFSPEAELLLVATRSQQLMTRHSAFAFSANFRKERILSEQP